MSSGSSPLGSLANNPQLLQALYPNLNLTGFAQLAQQQSVALEQPIQNLTTQISQFTSVSQAWSSIQSAVNALAQDAKNLSTASTWAAPQASVSTTGIVQATAAAGVNAGTYNVNVTQQGAYDQWLGQSESSATNALNLSGTFSINGTSIQVTSSDSMNSIAQKINQAGAGATATVLSGTSGGTTSYYLSLDSTNFSALSISDPANVLKGTGSSGLGLTNKQAGQAWAYTVNTVPTTSTSGTDSTTVPGLTLNLQGAGTASVTVTTSTSSAQSALSQFVNDYNALQSTIGQATGKGAILQGDPTAEGIMQQVNSVLLALNSSAPTGYQSVSDAGVTLNLQSNNSTQLAFSQSTFQTAATANAQALQNIFSGTGGVASQLSTVLQNLGNSSTGIIAGIQTNIQSQIQNLTSEQTQEQSLITVQQTALQAQFNAEMQALISVTSQKSSLSSLLNSMLGGGQSGSSSGSTTGG